MERHELLKIMYVLHIIAVLPMANDADGIQTLQKFLFYFRSEIQCIFI